MVQSLFLLSADLTSHPLPPQPGLSPALLPLLAVSLCRLERLAVLTHCPCTAVLSLQFSFAVMSGPLMWSIVAMRNSLVFHDGDKMTTLLIHASPALASW